MFNSVKEQTARRAHCTACGSRGQHSRVGQNWMCHCCQARADLARKAMAELAAGRILPDSYLNTLRLQGRI